MIRLKIAGIALGSVLAWSGWQEYVLTRGSHAEATKVEVAELEQGRVPDNAYLEIGEHLAIYGASVYQVRTKKGEQSGPHSSVDYCLYPVLSFDHPFLVRWRELVDRHGSADKVPDDEKPGLDDFTVLVKTSRFARASDIPDDPAKGSGVKGLVINKIRSIEGKEKALIKQTFPRLDLAKVLILEEGRSPSSLGTALAMLAGGLGVSAASLGWMVKGSA